ncbi:MAG: hypothetical protein ACK4UN_10360 [Limisphaerales bacterium]
MKHKKGLAAIVIIGSLAIAGGFTVMYGGHFFVKCAYVSSPKAKCTYSLRQIQTAKHMWAADNQKNGDAVPTWGDLSIYNVKQPTCREKGTYEIGAVNKLPTCSAEGHVISN